MKNVFAAAIILVSSISFAQTTTPPEESFSDFVVGCGIQKYCTAGNLGTFDQPFTANLAANQAGLGMMCADIDADLSSPMTVVALKGLADSIVANGETTCLSTATFATPVAP